MPHPGLSVEIVLHVFKRSGWRLCLCGGGYTELENSALMPPVHMPDVCVCWSGAAHLPPRSPRGRPASPGSGRSPPVAPAHRTPPLYWVSSRLLLCIRPALGDRQGAAPQMDVCEGTGRASAQAAVGHGTCPAECDPQFTPHVPWGQPPRSAGAQHTQESEPMKGPSRAERREAAGVLRRQRQGSVPRPQSRTAMRCGSSSGAAWERAGWRALPWLRGQGQRH